MKQILVSQDGEQLGPFSEAEVEQKLLEGTLTGTEMAWHEGLEHWQPLSQVVPAAARKTAPPLPGSRSDLASSGEPQTATYAVISLICGVAAPFVFLSSIPAVILGHIALGQIKRSQGALKGRGMAIAGLVVGYLSFLFGLLALALLVPLANLVLEKSRIHMVERDQRDLQVAVSNYQAEYNRLPLSPVIPADDFLPAEGVGIEVVRALYGLAGTESLNPRKIQFIDLVLADSNKTGGIVKDTDGNITAWMDPWGNPYWIALDGNLDQKIPNPHPVFKKPAQIEGPFAMFSSGPDGLPKTPDDIVSWVK